MALLFLPKSALATFSGFITGTITPPVEATVFVDGGGSALVKDGEFFMPLRPGTYILNVAADGCEPWAQQITVPQIEILHVDVFSTVLNFKPER